MWGYARSDMGINNLKSWAFLIVGNYLSSFSVRPLRFLLVRLEQPARLSMPEINSARSIPPLGARASTEILSKLVIAIRMPHQFLVPLASLVLGDTFDPQQSVSQRFRNSVTNIGDFKRHAGNAARRNCWAGRVVASDTARSVS